MVELITSCTCGETEYTEIKINRLPMLRCAACGVHRQSVKLTADELSSFYREEYHQSSVYTHSLSEDTKAAKKRLIAYDFPQGSRILDVGCGNGAFVIEAKKAGLDAWATELSDSPLPFYAYRGELEALNFPTDHFDAITLHDVLEHVVDPVSLLKEVRRILKQGGKLFLDLPDYYGLEGKKHWKEIEHLWYWDADQMKSLLLSIGFEWILVTVPVKGKFTFKVSAPKETRPSILVPPGLGDIYWVMAKLKGFLEEKGLGIPDVYISSMDNKKDRSIEYVRSLPFVNAAGYLSHSNKSPRWKEAYLQNGRTVFEKVEGCDYFIAYNGVMRYGHALEEVDPQWKVDWDHPMFVSQEELLYKEGMKHQYGDYLVGYFVDHGMYKKWLKEFPLEKIFKLLKEIAIESKKKILLIGGSWDVDNVSARLAELDKDGFIIDITGETTLPEAFGLIKGSKGVIGFPSGITIMATKFKVPTLMFWNRYFHDGFHWKSCPTDSWGEWYRVVNTKRAEVKETKEEFLDLIGEGSKKKKRKKVSRRTVPKPEKASTGAVVACVLKSGGDYGPEYVEKLKRMVDRYMGEYDEFVCLTDMAFNIPGVRRVPLKHNWPGWWSKIELFRPDIFSPTDRIIYFDLDTVIRGNLEIFKSHPSRFSMLHGFRFPKRRASGVMFWTGEYDFIYNEFRMDGRIFSDNTEPGKNDQWFIAQSLDSHEVRIELIQKVFPDYVVSYKRHCRKMGCPPEGSRVVCFHGNPRPHEVKEEWVVEEWK